MSYIMREARVEDIESITNIYNQGIEDRIATLETRLRDTEEMKDWLNKRGSRYKVVVIEDCEGAIRGWASINMFNSRCCYSGVGDLSIYVKRDMRGKGLGKQILNYLIEVAKKQDFNKLILSTFETNEIGKKVYKSVGFREVGTYMNQGILDGKFVNITIMEKLL